MIIRTNWLVIVPPWKRPPLTSWLVLCLECRHCDLSVVWSENDCGCGQRNEVGWPGSCDRGFPWYRLHIFNPRHTSRYAEAGYSGEPRSQVHLPDLRSVVAARIDFYAGKPMRNKGICSVEKLYRTICSHSYCCFSLKLSSQMIVKIKEKPLFFCTNILIEKVEFNDYIFTDESTVRCEQFLAKQFRWLGKPSTPKPEPKHPLSVHVWAGISKNGTTDIAIYHCIMESSGYERISFTIYLPSLF